MKKLLAIVLVLTLAISMSVTAVATPVDAVGDASIVFTTFDGDQGVYDPAGTIPPSGDTPTDTALNALTSMAITFHEHPITPAVATYYSYEANATAGSPSHATNGSPGAGARNSRAGMAVVAAVNWEVEVEIANNFQIGGNDTMVGFELSLREWTGMTNTTRVISPTTATFNRDTSWSTAITAGAASGVQIASGTPGFFGTEFEGRLNVPVGSSSTVGNAQTVMDWNFVIA